MAALHPSNPYYNHSLSQHYDQQSSATLEPYQPKAQRSASVDSAPPTESPKAKEPSQRPRNPVTYRTRSIGGPFCTGVYFERQIDLSPPNDEEIIIATVRVTNSFRRASVEGCDELPSRYANPNMTYCKKQHLLTYRIIDHQPATSSVASPPA